MEPAPATGITLAPSPQTPDPIPPGITRKTRSDAKLEQLSPARRERLRFWLEDENQSYAEVVHLLRAEFNLTVGKSAVSLYWRRHLLPSRHEAEAEIAATLAALPAADFDTATLNQARALAWTALTRPQPQIQDAARLLALIHRAERLSISRQRLALEQRRLALREAESGQSPEPEAVSLSYRTPPRDLSHPSRVYPSVALAKEGHPPPPEPPATPQHHPTFPGYSALFPPPDPPSNDAPPKPSVTSVPPLWPLCRGSISSSFPSLPSVQFHPSETSTTPFVPHLGLPCVPCVPWATPSPSPPPQPPERHAPR